MRRGLAGRIGAIGLMETSSRTLVCCIVFLDIVEYSKKPVSEQLQLKQAFNGILADAVAQVPPRDRIILDTGDGRRSLSSAIRGRAVHGDVDPRFHRLAAGSHRVNLGPVRLLKDLNGNEYHRRRHQCRAARDGFAYPASCWCRALSTK